MLQSAHANPKPSYDNMCYYAIQITASQFLNNQTMLPQASHGLVVANLQLYLGNGLS